MTKMTQIFHGCSECDHVLEGDEEFCPEHPNATVLSLRGGPVPGRLSSRESNLAPVAVAPALRITEQTTLRELQGILRGLARQRLVMGFADDHNRFSVSLRGPDGTSVGTSGRTLDEALRALLGGG